MPLSALMLNKKINAVDLEQMPPQKIYTFSKNFGAHE
jgi:hypothetical protein